MKSLKKVGLVLGAALLVPGMANAGDFVVSGKADFVSDYIWRGLDQNSGFSIQPSLTLSYKGLSLNAWGSQTLSKWGVNDMVAAQRNSTSTCHTPSKVSP